MNYTKEVQDIATELEIWAYELQTSLSLFESLSIAAKIQQNRIFADAHVVRPNTPSALESIAIELGAGRSSDSIKSALYEIAIKD